MLTLSREAVIVIHDEVLNPGELPGLAGDKCLDGALARVETRLTYGMLGDVFDLAAACAMAIAQGHWFNDGNKRTAYHAMETCLDINGVQMTWNTTEAIADRIIALAQGRIDDVDLALWLRRQADA